jgi:hypothetical protein
LPANQKTSADFNQLALAPDQFQMILEKNKRQ